MSPRSVTEAPMASAPALAAAASAGPVGRVSLARKTCGGGGSAACAGGCACFGRCASAGVRIVAIAARIASHPGALASASACRSHATGSIPPSQSTSLTPLSRSGLWLAVTTMPVARPVTADRTAATAPQRNTVDASTSPRVRKPAVP